MVRNFPRTTRRRATAALALLCVLVGVAAVPLASADPLHEKKHKVEKQVKQAHEHLDGSSARLRKATAALEASKAKLNDARAYLSKTRGELAAARVFDRQMQAKLDAAILRLERARADLAASHATIAEQQDTLGQIVVQNYQGGTPALMGLSAVLTSEDPAELSGQMGSMQSVLDKESATLERLEATKVLLTVQEEEVEAAKVEVAVQRKEAAERLDRKRVLEEQAQAAKADVVELVGARAHARSKAAKAKAHDLRDVRRLEAEADRISNLLARRAAAARAAARRAGAPSPSSSRNSGGFLNWPVSGPVTSSFGWRIHPIYGYRSLHDGIDIGAGCGTPIYAPADGKVISEYFQTAWGNRIIIDHGYQRGVGLATIANHLSGYAVSAGTYVKRGQLVGYVGTTGWSTGCHTHFSVMANGVAVDPMNWL